jgi:hypothetical protein
MLYVIAVLLISLAALRGHGEVASRRLGQSPAPVPVRLSTDVPALRSYR